MKVSPSGIFLKNPVRDTKTPNATLKSSVLSNPAIFSLCISTKNPRTLFTH